MHLSGLQLSVLVAIEHREETSISLLRLQIYASLYVDNWCC